MTATTPHPRNLQDEVGKKTAFSLLEQEAYLNLRRTHAVLSLEFAHLFKEHGLSDSKYNALRIVAGAGKEGVLIETIGQRMVAQDPDTTRLIDRLEDAGYVARSRHPKDRRCVLVTITPEGRKALRRLEKPVMDLHRQQLGHLSPHQLEQLNRLLFLARHSRA